MSSARSGSCFKSNPYIVGPPVTGEAFYGREDTFRFVLETLGTPDNRLIVLYGQRRTGKTSLLRELHKNRLECDQLCPVFIDLQSAPQRPVNQVLHEIALEIAAALGLEEPLLESFSHDGQYFLSQFLPEVTIDLGERRLVLLLDEFDVVADAIGGQGSVNLDARTLFGIVHKMVENHPQLAFIFVVARPIDRLPQEFHQLFHAGRYHQIWLLDRKDAEALIIEPAKDILSYTPEAVDTILTLSSAHPYFTQLLCNEVYYGAQQNRQERVTAADVEAVIDRALETGKTAFVWLWDSLSVAEQLIVSTFSEAADEQGWATRDRIQTVLDKHRLRLGTVDLVEATTRLQNGRVLRFVDPGGFCFEVDLIRRWVQQDHPIHHEKLRIEEVSPRATKYYNEATQHYRNGQPELAINAYRLALRENPNHLSAQIGLAQTLLETDEPARAVEAAEEAYWLNETSGCEVLISARLALGEQLETEDRFVEAAFQFRSVLKLDPDNRHVQEKLRVLYDHGAKAEADDRWREAASSFERVTDIQPDYQDAAVRLKRARSRLRRPLMAIVSGMILLMLVLGVAGYFLWGARAFPVPVVALIVTPATDTPNPISAPPVVSETPVVITQTSPTPRPTKTPMPTETTAASTPNPPAAKSTKTPTREATNTPYVITVVVTATPTPTSTATPTPLPTATPTPVRLGQYTVLSMGASADGTTLFAVVQGRGIWRSLDSGQNWMQVWSPDTSTLDSDTFKAVAVATSDPLTIYVGGWNVVLRSTDSGNTWQTLLAVDSNGLLLNQQIYALAVSPSDAQTVFAATSRGIFKSSDGGQYWQARTQAADGERLYRPFYAIAIAPSDADRVYAAGEGNIVYRSSDAVSKTWQSTACQPCGNQIYALAVDPDNPLHVVAGGSGGIIARSSDGGRSWSLPANGIKKFGAPSTLKFSALAFGLGETLYAGTGFRSNFDSYGVFYSPDGGASWSPYNDGLETHWLQAIIARDGLVFASGADGIFQLVDNQWEVR